MSKPVVRVLTGLPGSGKSTVAKQLPGLRVNLDDLRVMMGWTSPASWSKDKEAVAIETMMSMIEAAVEGGNDVVVDNTHLTARLPGIMRRRVGGRASFQVLSLLDTPIEECIRRDSERDKPVGESAIRKMAKTSSRWKLTEEFLNIWPEIEKLGPRIVGLPECIIVDLDGTAAIHTTRGPYDAERCDEDAVDDTVSDIVHGYAYSMSSGGYVDHRVVFLSGREGTDEIRKKTLFWLDREFGVAGLGDNWELHMRSEGDKRPDFVVKYELFNEYIRGKYNPFYALDDRDQVVRLWREVGLKCLQVSYGNF